MAGSLDTNCLLRWLLSDVSEQAEQVNRLLSGSQNFVVEDAAIIELVFVLEKVQKISRPAIHKALLAIMAQGNIKCNRAVFSETMNLYTAHPKLSVVDCYLSVTTHHTKNTPLFTFDEKLAKQAPNTKLLQ
jgi:predicted nucleic-acid-binding protein